MAKHVCRWGFVVPYWKGSEKVFIVCRDNDCRMVLTRAQAEARLDATEILFPLLHSMNNKQNYYSTFALFGDSINAKLWKLIEEEGKSEKN